MKTKKLLLFIFFITSALIAKEVNYEVIPHSLPYSYSILFNTYWNQFLRSKMQEDSNTAKSWITVTDMQFRQIPKKERFNLCNSEMQKYILTLKGNMRPPTIFSVKLLNEFQIFLHKNDKFMLNFEKLILIGLYKDLENLFGSPFYPTLQLQLKSFQKIKSQDLLILKKKLSNLIQVVTYLISLENIEREEIFKQATSEIIQSINLKAKTFILMSHSPYEEFSQSKSFHFFRQQQQLRDLVGIVDNALSKIEVKSTKPKETFDINWDELPLIPTPFPNYEAPKDLPQPLNDWIKVVPQANKENLIAIPTPDPNYLPPDDLPIPLGAPGIWPEE